MSSKAPCCPEAERAFLGSLFLQPKRFQDYAALPDGMFFEREHAQVYQAMQQCHRAGLPVDPSTLLVYLKQPIDLGEIINSTPTSANLPHYASVLWTQYHLRRTIEQSQLAARVALQGDIGEAHTLLRELLDTDSWGRTLGFADLDNWWVVPEREWLFRPLLARGHVTLCAAPGSAGKSFLAVGLLASVITGTAVFPAFRPVGYHKAMYLSGEDDEHEVRRRLLAYDLAYFKPQSSMAQSVLHEAVKDRLRLVAAQSRPFLEVDRGGRVSESAYFQSVLDAVRAERPSLIVIDTLRKHLGTVSENDNGAVGYLMELFARLARAVNAAVLVLHHANKAAADQTGSRQQDVRGASAAVDEARSVFVCRRTPAGLSLYHAKSNYGPQGTQIDFEFQAPGEGIPLCLRQVGERQPGQDRSPELARAFVEYLKDNSDKIIGPQTLQHGRVAAPILQALDCNTGEALAAAQYAISQSWVILGEHETARHGKKPAYRINPTRSVPADLPGPLFKEPDEEYNEDDELF